MARLRDIKVGMKVEIIKGSGNPDFFTTDNIGLSGMVVIVDNNDSMRSVFVGFPKTTFRMVSRKLDQDY